MPWHARDGGIWRTITSPAVRVSGSWQPVQNAWVRVSGAWQNFYAAVTSFTASASPTFVTGLNIISAPDDCPVTTNSTTVTPTGGVAPYTYSWAYVSGDSATVNSPTSATTTFSRNVFINNPGQSFIRSGVYRCTVTDSASQTATADVDVITDHASF